MINRVALILLCFLAPLLAGADTLDVYGTLIGKTVLMPSGLPALPDAVISDLPSDKTNAIANIERALAEKGVEVVQDGPHFVRVFRKEARVSLTNAPLRGAELARSKGPEALSPGVITFVQADLNQVLSIYAAMSQRTVLRPITLPAPAVTLKTGGGLTRQEVVYAMTTVFALNGVSVVDDGAKFVQMVPMRQREEVNTRAPKPEPGARLFDPKKLPSMGVSESHWPLTETERIEQELERLRKAFYEFMHMQDPRKRSAQRLLALYADLAGKSAAPSKDLGGLPIWFHVDTPLTKGELLYAIETTFILHGLAIIPVDDHKIRLGHSSEVLKWNGKQLERVPPKL